MQFFCYLGSLACCILFWFDNKTLALGITGCILVAIGYCGSLVFYNSYLPEIATEQDRDRISAKGFAYGYIGSVILQLICFVFVMLTPFGMNVGSASQFSFLLTGIWWFGFSQITFSRLPKGTAVKGSQSNNIITNGFKELAKVWGQARQMPLLKRFLISFFLYSMGVQTVMLAATLFASQEIHLAESKLIISLLLIQIVAIAGAYIMAKLSNKFGNIKVLMFTVVLWICICISAYYTTTEMQFYA